MKKNTILKSEIEICDLQKSRMEMAFKNLQAILPLTKEKYLNLSETELSFLDMLTARFAKLQDTMGNKIFPLFLELLQEDTSGKSTLDRIHKLEKLGVLKSADEWIAMRSSRNSIAHDYPDNPELMVTNLNQAISYALALSKYWEKLRLQILEKIRESGEG